MPRSTSCIISTAVNDLDIDPVRPADGLRGAGDRILDVGPAVTLRPDHLISDEHGDRSATGCVLGDAPGDLGVELGDRRLERRELLPCGRGSQQAEERERCQGGAHRPAT
jgi:hypothetical protein